MKKNHSKYYQMEANEIFRLRKELHEEFVKELMQEQTDYILEMLDSRLQGVYDKEDIQERILLLAGEFILQEINENNDWQKNGVLNGRSSLVEVGENYKQCRDHQAEEFVKNRDSFKLAEMKQEDQIARDKIHEKIFAKYDGVLNKFNSVKKIDTPKTFTNDEKFDDGVTYDPSTNRYRKNGRFVVPVNTNVKVSEQNFRKYLDEYNKKNVCQDNKKFINDMLDEGRNIFLGEERNIENMYEIPNVKNFNNSSFDKKVNRFRGTDGKFVKV